MKTRFFQALSASFLLLFLINPLSAQCITDFEDGVGYDGGFGGAFTNGVVVDATNGTNVLSIVKGPPETWAGLSNGSVPVTVDLSANCEICVDWFEPNASATLLLKLEMAASGAGTWEQSVATTSGWGNYCFDTTLPDASGTGAVACGDIHSLLAIFPNFGVVGAGEEYFVDNICVTEPIPTAGEWGLMILSLSLLSLGLVYIRETSVEIVTA